MWSGALDSSDLLRSYSTISLAYHITILLISTLFKHINIYIYPLFSVTKEKSAGGSLIGSCVPVDALEKKLQPESTWGRMRVSVGKEVRSFEYVIVRGLIDHV